MHSWIVDWHHGILNDVYSPTAIRSWGTKYWPALLNPCLNSMEGIARTWTKELTNFTDVQIFEVLDNCIDEVQGGHATNVEVGQNETITGCVAPCSVFKWCSPIP